MAIYYIKDVDLKFKSKVQAAAKCISLDYTLKQVSVNLSGAVFGFGLQESIVFAGLNPYQVVSELVAECSVIAKPPAKIDIDWACVGINWKPNETYRFVFEEDFLREKDKDSLGNLSFERTYTINPVPALLGRNPEGSTVTNNTKIEFVFDRLMRPGRSGKIYLYEETGSNDTLLKEYDILMDVDQRNNENNLSTFTLDTTGLLKANTTYYITSDNKVFRDFDELYYPQLTAGDYTFTTDASDNEFPDLISFQMSGGSLSLAFIRYRNFDIELDSQFDLVPPENWRLRRYQSNFDIMNADQISRLTYSNAGGRSVMNSEFEFVDIFTNYIANGRGNISAAFNHSYLVGVIKQYLSSISSKATISPIPFRTRPFSSSVDSSFDQSIESIYGVLETTRGAETYSTNTTTTISNGPRFEAKVLNSRTGNGFLTYTMTVMPDDLNAVSSLSLAQLYYERLQTLSRRTIQAGNTEQNYIISDNGDVFIIPPYLSNSEILSGDVTVYKKVDGYWQLIQTIDTLVNQTSIALSGDGTTLAISNTFEGPVEIYRWSDIYNEFSLEATIGPSTYTQFGKAMSLSYDGNTLAVGEPGTFADPVIAGNAYVYTRSGSTWTLQTTLTKTGSDSKPLYGWRVSLSNDGNTLAVGSPQDKGGTSETVGAVYIYIRSGSNWTLQQKIQDTVSPVGKEWGWNLDLSSDGNTFVTNNETNGSVTNSAVIYTRSGSTWTLQTVINVDSALNPNIQPSTMNLANSGNTLIVSVLGAEPSGPYSGVEGFTKIYTRTGTTWTEKVISAINGFSDVGSAISETENVMLTSTVTDAGVNAGYSEVNIFTAVTASFNNATKTLTFTGSRTHCRTQTDLIQYTPTTGYTGNFNLIYTGTVPDGRSTTRTQAVTRV